MGIREARRHHTVREAERLKTEVATWAWEFDTKDVDASGGRGRHRTQLNAISSEVTSAADRICTIASADPVTRTVGEVFNDYNLHDQRLIWIRYAWNYFQEKLDQRNDDVIRNVLQAADEVSWSCFSTFFRSAGLTVPPAPIPYIEYDYVPSALRPGQAHVLSRKPGVDAGPLKTYFESLPVPLLRLPPAIVTAPWSLVLICHEVGHLVQEWVEPARAFYTTFADLVADTAAAAEAGTDRARWAVWSQEVFADLCLAITAGPWAVWSLAPWVVTADSAMQQPLDKYPPPALRLALLDRMSRTVHMPTSTDVFQALGVTPVDNPVVNAVAGIVDRSFIVNGRAAKFSELLKSAPDSMQKKGRVAEWASQLLGAGEVVPENDQTSARDAAVAASRAHFLAFSDDGQVEALAPKATALIRDCYAQGVRAGSTPPLPTTPLADALFALSEQELLEVAGPQ